MRADRARTMPICASKPAEMDKTMVEGRQILNSDSDLDWFGHGDVSPAFIGATANFRPFFTKEFE